MSQYFRVGQQVLWNPSNGVAELFVRTAQTLSPTVGMPTGIGNRDADEHEVDLDAFSAFVNALVGRYVTSRHPVLQALLQGFVTTAIVLADRAGRELPALIDPPASDLSNQRHVAVGPGGVARAGDAARLRTLADSLARLMPC